MPLFSVSTDIFASAGTLPPEGQGYGGTYITNGEEPKSFNSHWQYDYASMGIAGNIFSRLISVDWGVVQEIPQETKGIVGDLAYAWEASDDNLQFTFHLYQNATWSDGQPLTSADVVYTYNEILTNPTLRRHSWLNGTMKVISIEAPDDYTIIIKTSRYNPDWLVTFAQYSNWELFILPKHLYEGTDWSTNPYNMKPVCSGPFIFDTWARGAWIKLKRNPNYYRSLYPFVDEVIIKFGYGVDNSWFALRAKEFDAIDYETNPAYAEVALASVTTPGIEIRTIGSLYSYPVHINHKSEYLSNKKVRQAISYAIDRDEISKKGFFGLWPTNDMFTHEGSIWANPNAR